MHRPITEILEELDKELKRQEEEKKLKFNKILEDLDKELENQEALERI